MNPERLTGFVYPVKKNGVPVRGRWQLWVNLPPEPAFDRDGQPVRDAKGRQRMHYPKTTKVVEAAGKKAAERLLETWIAELEAHRTKAVAQLLEWISGERSESAACPGQAAAYIQTRRTIRSSKARRPCKYSFGLRPTRRAVVTCPSSTLADRAS